MGAAKDLPSFGEVRAFYVRRWRLFKDEFAKEIFRFARSNIGRIFIGVAVVVAAFQGFLARSFLVATLYVATYLIVGLVLNLLFSWLSTSWTLYFIASFEVARLRAAKRLEERYRVSAETLDRLFDMGCNIVPDEFDGPEEIDAWTEAAWNWRNQVLEAIKEVSREEYFMFRTIGLVESAFTKYEPGDFDQQLIETMRAHRERLKKLRMIGSRFYRGADIHFAALSDQDSLAD